MRGASTVTKADAVLLGSACDVAVTVTIAGFGTWLGAVYSPDAEIVPHVFPLHPFPLSDQVAVVFFEPVTIAVNCCCRPTSN